MGTRLVLRYYICVIYTNFELLLMYLLMMFQPATAKYPVCADGLRKVLKYIKENYNDPEIIVTGNGKLFSFFYQLP